MKHRYLSTLECFLWAGLSLATTTLYADPINLLSLQEGTLPVTVPPNYGGWTAANLLDESRESGWACESGNTQNNVFVFEMTETATLERFEFDNSNVDSKAAGAKDILVEVSNSSASGGFTPVLEAPLANLADGQGFTASDKIPARWVRLTIRNNQGNAEWTELFSFRGYGERPAANTTPDNISGTYETSYSLFHVRQEGSSLSGCYEFNEGLLNGSIEGRVMKITWRETGENNFGPAVMVFPSDGQTFNGYWWRQGTEQGAPNGDWQGKKISSQVGGCPHWSGSVGGELKKQLLTEKRARVYGILFDFNSAKLKTESRPVLDEVLGVLKSEPGWHLTIEGHTDAIGSDEKNQILSQQRAEAVKAYLTAGGVEASSLTTVGYGEARPVAENDTELGRAQNRRVELVREE